MAEKEPYQPTPEEVKASGERDFREGPPLETPKGNMILYGDGSGIIEIDGMGEISMDEALKLLDQTESVEQKKYQDKISHIHFVRQEIFELQKQEKKEN